VQNFTFSGQSLLNHNLYAVSIREVGEFAVRKERFNIENEQERFDEDSGVI
jgi:hypothetical protein